MIIKKMRAMFQLSCGGRDVVGVLLAKKGDQDKGKTSVFHLGPITHVCGVHGDQNVCGVFDGLDDRDVYGGLDG